MPDPKPPCCPHPVERHAYNGCADCPCKVPWRRHPGRDSDTSPSAHDARICELQRLRADVAHANGTLSKIRDALPPGPALYLWEVVAGVVAERDRLRARCAELDEFYAAMQGVSEGTPLEVVRMMTAERDRLKTRISELLVTVKNLSLSTPYPEEAGNVATLIAEVGTLKARVAELERTHWTNVMERRTGGEQ